VPAKERARPAPAPALRPHLALDQVRAWRCRSWLGRGGRFWRWRRGRAGGRDRRRQGEPLGLALSIVAATRRPYPSWPEARASATARRVSSSGLNGGEGSAEGQSSLSGIVHEIAGCSGCATQGFHRPLSDPRADIRLRLHGSGLGKTHSPRGGRLQIRVRQRRSNIKRPRRHSTARAGPGVPARRLPSICLAVCVVVPAARHQGSFMGVLPSSCRRVFLE
jgi:hypothetical protein